MFLELENGTIINLNMITSINNLNIVYMQGQYNTAVKITDNDRVKLMALISNNYNLNVVSESTSMSTSESANEVSSNSESTSEVV